MSQVTIAKGRRQSTAYCYLDPARGRANLTIIQGALAQTLILEGKRCVGVRYTESGQKLHGACHSREVIEICSRSVEFAEAAGALRHRPGRPSAGARRDAGT